MLHWRHTWFNVQGHDVSAAAAEINSVGRKIMNNSQYYQLELDDVSTPSFTSFGKFYYGIMNELKDFIHALETTDYIGDHFKDLTQAFHDYLQGNTDVTHSIAYREVPLLKAVHVIHESNVILTDYSWEHRNTWGCPYNMRCSKVETKHLWLDCGGTLMLHHKS